MATTVHSFEVAGETVDLHQIGIEPTALRHEFGRGVSLTIRQVGGHHRSQLEPNTTIIYRADGTIRFVGSVRSIARSAAADTVTYTALDALARAGSVSVSISTTGNVGAVITAALTDAGWTAGSGISGLTSTHDVQLPYYGPLDRLLSDVMAEMPAWRLVVDHAATVAGGTPVIKAVQVYDTGSTQTLAWGGIAAASEALVGRVSDLDLAESIDGCYTAVKLIGPGTDGSSAVYDREAVLDQGWDNDNTADWSVEQAGTDAAADAALADNPEAQTLSVFRLFKLPSSADDFDPELPWKLMVKVPANPRFGLNAAKWYPIDAETFERGVVTATGLVVTTRYILAKHPITVRGDVRRKGTIQGPEQAKLIYQDSKGGALLPISVRYPASGFEGTAFDRYGIEAERRVEVSSNLRATLARAQHIHAALKNVRTSGRARVYGRMPEWAWGGGTAIKVSGATERGVPVNTDYQSMALTQTGWTVDFVADLYDLEVTDNRESFVNVDDL